jgi:hypothetical protein
MSICLRSTELIVMLENIHPIVVAEARVFARSCRDLGYQHRPMLSWPSSICQSHSQGELVSLTDSVTCFLTSESVCVICQFPVLLRTYQVSALTFSGLIYLGKIAPAVTVVVIVAVPATGGNVAVVQLSYLSGTARRLHSETYTVAVGIFMKELQYGVPCGSFCKHEMGLRCAWALQKFGSTGSNNLRYPSSAATAIVRPLTCTWPSTFKGKRNKRALMIRIA